MDPSQRTSGALLDRAGADVAQLLKRFENLVALAPVSGRDRNTTAVEVYQIEVETAALVGPQFPKTLLHTIPAILCSIAEEYYLLSQIRAAEDILSLTRSLKEAWLFGQLNTLGESKAALKTDEDAKVVAEGFQRLLKGQEKL
ncbi:MAG: hypothetical protein M1830_009038 [Pleopsidium flavum]|nr:MAG: hypothetical protein M1830_009038 [Pleopsidium flavum]